MLPKKLSSWFFSALTLTSSSALADSASAPDGPFVTEPLWEEAVPLQERPKLPQAALDACSGKAEGDACSVEFRGQAIEGSCRKLPQEDELACLPAGPPPGRRGS